MLPICQLYTAAMLSGLFARKIRKLVTALITAFTAVPDKSSVTGRSCPPPAILAIKYTTQADNSAPKKAAAVV